MYVAVCGVECVYVSHVFGVCVCVSVIVCVFLCVFVRECSCVCVCGVSNSPSSPRSS